MTVLCAQLDTTKLNSDVNLKKQTKETVILMMHMCGNACQEVVLSIFICILLKNDDVSSEMHRKMVT